jgi:hypothetical protein
MTHLLDRRRDDRADQRTRDVPAQQPTHAMVHDASAAVPASPGQAAFGAIAEVVRMLKAD